MFMKRDNQSASISGLQVWLAGFLGVVACTNTIRFSEFGLGREMLEASDKFGFAIMAGFFVSLVIWLILYGLILRKASRFANVLIMTLMFIAGSAATYAQMA